MPVSEEEFRHALSCFTSGVNVVTTIDGSGKPFGITVSAFCSVSLSPPLVLICIEKATASHYAFKESGIFVVNILRESQDHVSEHFATPFPDKFNGIRASKTESGIPVIADSLATLHCRVRQTFDGGDHSIFVAEVESSSVRDGNPLAYFQGSYRKLDLAEKG